jgi:hypothetical protein
LCDFETQLANRTDIFQDAFQLNPVGAEARSLVADGLDTLLLAKGSAESELEFAAID